MFGQYGGVGRGTASVVGVCVFICTGGIDRNRAGEKGETKIAEKPEHEGREEEEEDCVKSKNN